LIATETGAVAESPLWNTLTPDLKKVAHRFGASYESDVSEHELDLHGLTVAEAIEQFVQYYNTRVDNDRYGYLRIIHG
jgi:DNA-nicking Smr family endonuclease